MISAPIFAPADEATYDLLVAAKAYMARCVRVGECLVNPRVGRYGEVHLPGGRRMTAHRAVFQALNGPIADSLVVRHRCDVKACVEPTHLESGTVAQNERDKRRQALRRARKNAGEANGHAILTPEDVASMRRQARAGTTIADLAARFRVHYATARYAIRGETWAEVLEPPVPHRYRWHKPNPRRWPDEDRLKALTLAEQGWTLQEIANELGCCRDTAFHLTQSEDVAS